MWKRCKERIAQLYGRGEKEEHVENKARKSDICPKARHAFGKSGRWLFLLLLLGQGRVCLKECSNRKFWKKWEVEKREHVEAGARRGNGGAGDHYRVGCGQRHQSGP